jgi:2-polyprenyl-6-methoxyphenol hydroxylase-like FAD-dependent oxidoreductase
VQAAPARTLPRGSLDRAGRASANTHQRAPGVRSRCVSPAAAAHSRAPRLPPWHLHQTRVGRPYGRVCRRKLHDTLLAAAAAAGGVAYLPASVEGVTLAPDGATASVACSGGVTVTSRCVCGCDVRARSRVRACGAAQPPV